MTDWLPYLIIAAIIVFVIVSAWGVRRLQARHVRSAVAGESQAVSSGHQRVAVVINPSKLRAEEALSTIIRSATLAGWETPLFFETTVEDPGYSQTRRALEAGVDVVIAGGGDGTVRAVAEVLSGTDVAMGLLPLGTGNLLGRNLDIDVGDLYAAVQTALFGSQRFIDTARIKIANSVTKESSQHTFLVIAGIGLDAEVVGDTKDDLKKAVGWLAYTEAGVRHLPGRRKTVTISLDDEPEQKRKIRSVLFANCGLIPGGIDFIPGAMIDDGQLDVVVMSPRSAIGWLAMYGKIVFKHKHDLPMMNFYSARKITIRSAEPMETQLDGDPSGAATEVTVEVDPRSLLVRVKNNSVDTSEN
ncbi:diacylglycerol/lipid kinase family protein [Pseudarthrobacter sp. J1738]|uniref:diacylglycerol/lipid kinase family protein n=1 Tax=Pseudarthrobacter sp. J1738 TaxID=3420446 RepID=UPI003D2C6C02